MNTLNRSRNGIRNLNWGLNRACSRFATTMLGGARRPNHLVLACRLLSLHLRLAKRMAKEDPHLFGPHARQYFLDTLQLEQEEREIEAAIRKVYGPLPPGESPPVSTLWTDRYHPQPEQRKLFLKWFHEKYPSK